MGDTARRTLRTAFTALAIGLMAPHAATAARLGVFDDLPTPGQGSGGRAFLNYLAEPGETNRITIRPQPAKGSSLWTFGPETAVYSGGCRPIDAGSAVCTDDDQPTVFTDDGDDSVDDAVGALVFAGDGNDTLRGSDLFGERGDDSLTLTAPGTAVGWDGNDTVTGTPGPDKIGGNEGVDDLSGGDGDDQFTEAGPSSEVDRVDGGAGYDTLAYSGVVPVHYTVGAGGTEDTVTGIEGVGGGAVDDVLTGDEGGNGLVGGSGADVLTGLGGPDQLYGGLALQEGRTYKPDNGDGYSLRGDSLDGGTGDDLIVGSLAPDRLSGGDGNDRLYDDPPVGTPPGGTKAIQPDIVDGGAGSDRLVLQGSGNRADAGSGDDRVTVAGASKGPPNQIACGPGHDRLLSFTLRAGQVPVPADCELTTLARTVTVVGAPRRRGAVLRFRLSVRRGQRQVLVARVDGRLVGQTRPVGRGGTYGMRLNARGRRAVARGRAITVANRAANKAKRTRTAEAGVAFVVR